MNVLKHMLNFFSPSNNLPKLFSLIFAIMFWFYIKGEETVTINQVVVPVIKVHDSMVVLDKSANTISIALSGKKEDIDNFKNKRIKAVIDLSKYKKKMSIKTPLKISSFNLPPRFDVSNITPSALEVTIDKLEEKVLPVKVILGGKTSENHIVENTYTNPSYVNVSGAQSILNKLKSIDTLPLDITGRIKSFSTTIALKNLLPSTKTKEVRVFVNITEQLSERVFPNIPIKTLTDPKNKHKISIDPATVSVTVKGTKKNIENLTAQEIDIVVGTTALPTGKYELPVRVLPIHNIHIKETTPQVVNVGINTDE